MCAKFLFGSFQLVWSVYFIAWIFWIYPPCSLDSAMLMWSYVIKWCKMLLLEIAKNWLKGGGKKNCTHKVQPRKPWPGKCNKNWRKSKQKNMLFIFYICFAVVSHVSLFFFFAFSSGFASFWTFEALWWLYAFSGCTFTVRISSTACHIMLCILYIHYVFMIVDAIYRHLRHHSIDICCVFTCFNHPNLLDLESINDVIIIWG